MLAQAKEQGLFAYVYEGKTHDAGDKLGFLKATVEIALKNRKFRERISGVPARIKAVGFRPARGAANFRRPWFAGIASLLLLLLRG